MAEPERPVAGAAAVDGQTSPCAWCDTPVPQRATGPGRKRRYCLPPKRCREEAKRDRMARRAALPGIQDAGRNRLAGRAAVGDADTRQFRALTAAAADALDGLDKLLGNGALREWKVKRHRAQLKSMRTQLRTLEKTFGRADSAYRGVHTVYFADVYRAAPHGRDQPVEKEFTSWDDFLAFLTDNIYDAHGIVVRRDYRGPRVGDSVPDPAPPDALGTTHGDTPGPEPAPTVGNVGTDGAGDDDTTTAPG